MNVLYVYDGDWPRGATRVRKQTRSLAKAGHRVSLISRNDLRQSRTEACGWMTVHRLPSVGPDSLNRALNFPYFFNPVWIAAISSTARRCAADCIIVRDLPLALTAVWVGRLLRIPVFYDMAEVYPEFLRSLWAFDDMRWTDHLVRSPRAAELIERMVLRAVEKVFVVSEESATRCERLGVPASRVVLVGNTPEDPEQLAGSFQIPSDILDWQHFRKLLFVGILIGDRGLATAVRGMDLLRRSAEDVRLVVIGDGPDRPRIEEMVDRLGLRERVRLLGWKEHGDLPAYYAHADLGLLPFEDGSHVRITLANKLFDYMAAGLPVVASDLPPMRRVIAETDCGIVFEPGSADALSRAILQALSRPGQTRRLGEQGKQAVLRRYRWTEDERRLVRAVEAAVEPARDLIPATAAE